MDGRKILDDIIKNFSPDKFTTLEIPVKDGASRPAGLFLTGFTRFFREKNRSFAPRQESFTHYNDEYFSDGIKLGEIKFSESEKLVVCVFKASQPLSERTGKKAQYEKGKKILKDTQFDAGIFIFYGQNSNFRFSLIYPETIGNRRQWSSFRRFTYFVSPEFTNKTYLTRIGDEDISSLEKIKEAFSVEKVTKEFYLDIANWYFWAVQCCCFPKDAESEENGRNIAVIRLITRIIFIWFMRERGLVPKELFEENNIREMLKDVSLEKSSYYQAILQNLFFATLSTKQEERQFRIEIRGNKGYNLDFGNQYVYRYHQLFKKPEKIKDYFDKIPFLNGGLFECFDDKPKGIYIDGFTETKKHQPIVPNFLFFSGEQKTDLNVAYGTKNKTYKVRGLLDILSSFNFTIDENSLDDQDVALDPELLGRVFENLLASFNPETSTTARKATGSYYTPREIVDYMVIESFKAYFRTHLEGIEKIDEKLGNLFSTGSEKNPFDEQESKKLVELIEDVKIVDPAVGSGAFPMGALNKLVFVLNKVDPGNEFWKQAQLKAADAIPEPIVRKDTKSKIEEFFKGKDADYGRKLYLIQRCIYGVDIQQIAVEIAKLRFFISLLVDEKIDETKDNYSIEPLPNLDFKIMQGNSLISEFMGIDLDANGDNHFQNQHIIEERDVLLKERQSKLSAEYIKRYNNMSNEEKVRIEKELGEIVKEIKMIEKEKRQERVAKKEDDEIVSLISRFEQKKVDFQNESDKDRKVKLKIEVEDLMIKIFDTKVKKQKIDYFRQLDEIERKYSVLPNKQAREEIIAKEKQKLSQKTGFDLENTEKQLREFTGKRKTRPFFPWRLYFAEVFLNKGGFDVVIANPPYVGEKGNKEIFRHIKKGSLSRYYQRKMDLFYFFFHLAINIGSKHASIAFITTNYYPTATCATKLRKDLKERTIVRNIINFNELKIFESALGQHNMITLLQKGQTSDVNAHTCITNERGSATALVLERIVGGLDANTLYYSVLQKDLYDGDEAYIRITGCLMSSDPIQLVLENIKKQSVVLERICSVNQGILTGIDRVSERHCKNYPRSGFQRGQGVFVLSGSEIKKFTTKKLFKPWFKNSDIKKYYTLLRSDERLLYLTRDIDLLAYKDIEEHVIRFEKLIKDRPKDRGEIQAALKLGKWWVVFAARKDIPFDGPKIVAPQRSQKNTFGYNDIPWYASADVYFITQKDHTTSLKYVLALLNSKLYFVWLYYRGKRKGESLELYQKPLSEIPIKKISESEQRSFIDMVNKILAVTKDEDYSENFAKQVKVQEYQRQIDQMVYELYGLTEEEIRIVEQSGKCSEGL